MLARDLGEIISTVQPKRLNNGGSLNLWFDGPLGDPAGDIEDLIKEAERTAIRASVMGSVALLLLSQIG
ncbi:hypothetical protein [Desulfovibrio ferrophilus]|uniref:Integral membrane sensor signal transduction histidine kinase n=1 Tax=Desulfovibrio ferrophilus TaxID=241368 RepID=A0A2Z6AUM9_9BACT|nr:hypothetical protein [Desulfovibrio ferrophilus]BBD06920.1 integral membrane sensor signal transduction histidine kinase [Desulfovibrio ferrophilus]